MTKSLSHAEIPALRGCDGGIAAALACGLPAEHRHLDQPLANAAAVAAKPNIMFILDNSGSMAGANMPDDMWDTGKYGYKSIQCNGVAFDPS